MPWIIAGILIVGLVFLIVFIRRKRAKEEHEYYIYEHYGRWQGYSIEQLEDEISRVMSKKEELLRRLEAFGSAAPKLVIGRRESSVLNDIDSQMRDIRWQLEKLDREEEDIRGALRSKKALQLEKAIKEGAWKKKPLSSRGSRHTNKGKDLYHEVNLSQKEASTGIKKTIMYDRGNGKKRLLVTIPPGVKEGAKIRLKGMGLEGNPPGDLYLIVRVNIQ